MSWFTSAMSTSIGRKLLMALTGGFLVIFLLVHLVGNLLLLKADKGEAFNTYADFMTTSPAIVSTSFIMYAVWIIHIVYAIILYRQNSSARPVSYVTQKPLARTWSSRNMGILGTIIFIFLVIHLKSFWYEMHWGGINTATYGVGEFKDLYSVSVAAFTQWWYTLFYVVAMVFLAFHLYHGFKSMFQTLGINHPKYNPLINFLGTAYAILIPAAFAAIPVIIYFKHN